MVNAPAPKHANIHNTPITIPAMVPGDAFSADVTGDDVLLADEFDPVDFPDGETVGTKVVIEVFVLVARVVVDESEFVGVEVDDDPGKDEGVVDDDDSGDIDESAVDVISKEVVVVVSAVLEAGTVVGDSLLDPTLLVSPVGDCACGDDLGGGKSQVHLKLEVWPASTKSILNCISFTPQSVLPVPSQ